MGWCLWRWLTDGSGGCVVPKYIFWVTEYPKTASGKIQKFELRKVGNTLVGAGEGKA